MPIVIIIVTILSFFVIYGPQPLLPLLAQTYAVSRSQAALLVTVTLLPLSIAPVTYGYALEAVSTVKVLRWSVLGVALLTLAFGLANSFMLLLGLRLGQGLLLPAILTSLMTYLSASAEGPALRRVMSIYIAATIAGGYFGRLLSGLSATFFDWRAFFLILGAALLLAYPGLGKLKAGARITTARPTPRLVFEALGTAAYVRIYGIIFCMFFIFAGFMNFLPFRVVELWGRSSELVTGLMYTGYLVGLATSLGSGHLIRRFGGERNAMTTGITVFMATLGVSLLANGWVLFAMLFVFCGAMFLVHATAAGLLNQLAITNKGIVNGLYIAAYYAGGVLGSYLPGLAYEQFGWTAFVVTLLVIASLALGIAWKYDTAGARDWRLGIGD